MHRLYEAVAGQSFFLKNGSGLKQMQQVICTVILSLHALGGGGVLY